MPSPPPPDPPAPDALPPRPETWHLDEALAGPWIRAADLGRLRRFRRGASLYRQGEVSALFYFVLQGRVQVSMLPRDGAEFILEIMGRWSLCGEGAAFDGRPRFSGARALEPVQALEFDARRLHEAFRRDPDLALSLLRITCLKQRVLAVRLEHLASNQPERRIAELLLRLADLYGHADTAHGPHATTLGIRLTHEQIAAMTGTARVTVTRTLKRWREAGVVSVRAGQITLADRSRLMG